MELSFVDEYDGVDGSVGSYNASSHFENSVQPFFQRPDYVNLPSLIYEEEESSHNSCVTYPDLHNLMEEKFHARDKLWDQRMELKMDKRFAIFADDNQLIKLEPFSQPS